MENLEKLAMLEEMLELEEGSLKAEVELIDIPEWDSMAALSLIVLVDDNFGKKLEAKQIKQFKTVQDILDVLC